MIHLKSLTLSRCNLSLLADRIRDLLAIQTIGGVRMIRAVGLALVLALSAAPFAFAADDDDDDKVPAAEVEKVEATLSALGCKGYEGLKKEAGRYLRDRRRQVRDGHDGYQARQGLHGHLDLTLLTASTLRASRKRQPKGEPTRSRLAFFVARETLSGKCRRPLCRALPSCARLASCPSMSLMSGLRD